MTDNSNVAARITAMPPVMLDGPVGSPPPGLDLRWVWQIPTGVITIETYNGAEAEINRVRLTDPSGWDGERPPVTAEDLARETTVTPVACPACGTTTGLAFRGRWGDPADLICPCGHRWPLPGGRAYAVGAMTHAIILAIAQQGLPPAAPTTGDAPEA
ncbi:hypothetical protein [Streptomyces cyaneofuscatus]|uniref:hypothetical protein n=1 Tax=Streptomyces cyaneofuscatus TaxID=66883 RepID=UPI002F9084B0|nr:hypothetical protein OG973_37020 [Streptomyces cyaneofuscatus]